MPKYKYSQEVYNFIKDNANGVSISDLAELTNKHFNLSFTKEKMHSFMSNHKIKNGLKGSIKKGTSLIFSEKIQQFIVNNYKGMGNKELTEKINNTFSTNYSIQQIKTYKSNRYLDSGLTGHFQKGYIPLNKGRKLTKEQYEIAAKTMFKKGNKPYNYAQVGSETITKDGYIKVKIAEPNLWKLKHRLIWEQYNGEIPQDHSIIFLDQNKNNCTIDNLMCVPKAQILILNQDSLTSGNPEITKTSITYSQLKSQIQKSKKRLQNVKQ